MAMPVGVASEIFLPELIHSMDRECLWRRSVMGGEEGMVARAWA